MNLLKKAKNEMAFLKLGIFGSNGSGKTYTGCKFARGLYKHLKLKKPVAFLDTETGSDFEIKRFEKENIELVVAKTRAFTDLLKIVEEAEKECSILIIDSISHFWDEIQKAYMNKKNIRFLQFQHWKDLKSEWRQFSDLYVNSKLHIIMCGRAGNEYEYQENENGKKELITKGTKMKAETDLGYEPSLLLEMERIRESKQEGAKNINRCHVIKDRSDTINGDFKDYADFNFILPHLKSLNVGGNHLGINTTRNSEKMFEKDNEYSYMEKQKRRTIALEKLKDEMLLLYPSTSKEDKQAKIKFLKEKFNSSSWTELEKDYPIEVIENVVVELRNKEQIKEVVNA